MSSPDPPPKLETWSRSPTRQPFDAADHNRLVQHLNGELAAPQTWVADDGSVGLSWDPAVPRLTIGAELAAEGDLTIEGEATFDGPVTLGDLPADSIHVKGTLLLDVPIVLPPGSSGSAPPNNSVTSATIVDGSIVNADVNAAAAIALSKLAHVGAGNVLRSNGTSNVAGQVASGDIADGTIVNADINAAAGIDGAKLADGTITSAKLAFSPGGGIPDDNSVTSAKIVDGAIVNADVNAAAAIALSKLAPGASGFVKSNGTVISAGNALAATDIPADTITATQLAADCVGASELANNAVVDANVDAAAAIALSKLAPGTAGVLKSNGTTISAGNQIVAADITTDTITATQLAADCVGASELADNSVVDANVATGAAIATAKLAHVGANNVLKSNGTSNVGGQVVNADVAAAAAVVVSKLAAGGTANRVVATADGATMAMQQVATAMLAANAVSKLHLLALGAGSSGTATTPVTIASTTFITLGGDLFVLAWLTMSHSIQGGTCTLQFQIDSGTITTVGQSQQHAQTGYQMSVAGGYGFSAPVTAGSHTFKALGVSNTAATLSWAGGFLAVLETLR